MGIYSSTVWANDKKLGGYMYDIWQKSGKPMIAAGNGENVIFQNLLGNYSVFAEETPTTPVLTSTAGFKYSGITVLRNPDFYFAIMASPKNIGHGHFDEGGFILYKNNVPVIIDPGIESYFDSTKDWYVSSSAHSVLQFERKGGKKEKAGEFSLHLEKTDYSALRGWNDTPRKAKLVYFRTSENLDEVTVSVENNEGGLHYRNVSFDKINKKITIRDRVENFDGKIRVSFPVAGTKSEVTACGSSVNISCYYGQSLKMEFSGDRLSLDIEQGRSIKMFPVNGQPLVDIIRVTGRNEITTVIY
jgi:hypothetical protein